MIAEKKLLLEKGYKWCLAFIYCSSVPLTDTDKIKHHEMHEKQHPTSTQKQGNGGKIFKTTSAQLLNNFGKGRVSSKG